MQVTLAQRAEPSTEVMFQEVAGESVLLDMASEQYFGLNAVGTRVWKLLGADHSLGAAHAQLCREYDTPSDLLARDLVALVESLAKAGLVRISD